MEMRMQYCGYTCRPLAWIYLGWALVFGLTLLSPRLTNAVPSDDCAVRDHMGTEFVVGFLEAMSPDVSPQIYIVGSRRSTSVVIYTKQGNFTLNITPYNPVERLDLMNPAIAGAEAILVVANHDVSVYGIDRGNSMDSFLALPTDALGTEYYVVSYDIASRIQRERRGSQFMVIGAHHGTHIRIRLNRLALCNGKLTATDIDITLHNLETLHCISQDYDLTGTHIVASKPVAVLSGNKCANIPRNQRYCDHLVEQLPPVSTWDNRFITAPLKGRSQGDRFRVIASRNLTLVRTTSSEGSFTLNAGEYREFEVGSNSSAAIVANNPILVMQYSKGGNVDGTGADPFMMLVPGLGQYVSEALIPSISVAMGPELTNNINIIIDCASRSNLFHGIFHFPEESFFRAPATTEELLGRRFCITQYSLVQDPGLYFLEDRNSGFNSFAVHVYGYSSGSGNEAYGMPAGLVLRNNTCTRSQPARLTSTARPRIECPTVGPPVRQMENPDVGRDTTNDNYLNEHTVSEVQTEPTSGLNLNKSPTRRGNYLTVAIIIGMFSSVIIIILAIYVCFLKRKIRRLEAERKAFSQLQLSSMLVGPDGYIDLDGSQIPHREYMTLNNTDGVWRVGKVRRVDRAMFRSLSGPHGKSAPSTTRCNGQTSNMDGSFRDRRLTSADSTSQEPAGATGITRQLSTTDSCGGISQGSTAALISASRQGSISEEPRTDSFPMLRPLPATRSASKHTSVHLDSDANSELSRRQRKHLWRSVSNPGVNPFSGAHGDLKVYYEVPKNNRPLTTGTVNSSNSTSQHYDRPRRLRTNSEEISPAASIFLTQFPNSLPSRQDDGYMSMKEQRASVSSQASGSQHGDLSQTSASTGTSMLDKAYTSIPDVNFNNANDAGDNDSIEYTEPY